jgi:hypothetical protein
MIGVVVEYTVHPITAGKVLVGARLGGGDHQDGEDNGDTQSLPLAQNARFTSLTHLTDHIAPRLGL